MGLRQILFSRFLRAYYLRGLRGFYILNRILNRNNKLIAKNRYGVLFELDPRAYIDSIVLREGYYESEIIESVLALGEENLVFWDIGCHFGLHAVTVKKLLPKSNVIAFEPLEKMRERIKINQRLNKLDFSIFPYALSDKSEATYLYTDTEHISGRSSLINLESADLKNKIQITSKTAWDIVVQENIPLPDVVKIDVEGAESLVVLGMKKLIEQEKIGVIIFEADKDLLTKENSLVDFLTQQSFEITILHRNENTDHLLANFIAKRTISHSSDQ